MESAILTVDEMAATKIHELLAERDEKSAIRIRVQQNGPMAFRYSMQFIAPEEHDSNDQVCEERDIRFVFDPNTVELLQGSTLKYISDDSGSGFSFDNPNKTELMNNPVAVKIHQVIQEQINPGIAAHGGVVTLVDVFEDCAYIRFGGGCQGCGMADVTLKDGVEKTILEAIPEIKRVVDATNHADGHNPYFQGKH